jgi:hypothetical protein
MAKEKKVRSRVMMTAFDGNGAEVERFDVHYDEFYGGSLPVVDSGEYRQSRGIRRLTGEVFDRKGDLQESFQNEYADDGRYVKGRAVFADGTVTED